MIQPYTRKVHPSLRSDLLDILRALASRSPHEAAYFLRQTLQMAGAIDTPWLVRQSLDVFPPDLQESMRSAVRQHSVES
jgi:hypothetical protein